MQCCTGDSRAPRSRLWIVVVGVILVGGVVGAARVDAASLTLEWTAPTTNADGTRLKDLASYRIYLEDVEPGLSERIVLHGVIADVDADEWADGLDGSHRSRRGHHLLRARHRSRHVRGTRARARAAASGVAQPDFSVTPSTTDELRQRRDRKHCGSDLHGTEHERREHLRGTASIGAPYSILSGGSYSLAPGASQTVTVRFAPTAAGTFAGNVNFTASGDSISRAVSGSGDRRIHLHAVRDQEWHRNRYGDEHARGDQLRRQLLAVLHPGHGGHPHRDPGGRLHLRRLERRVLGHGNVRGHGERCDDGDRHVRSARRAFVGAGTCETQDPFALTTGL